MELAQAIRALPRRYVEELREWIEDYQQATAGVRREGGRV